MVPNLTPLPAQCRALPLAVPTSRARPCAEHGGAIESLAKAVQLEHAVKRDSALAALESCAEFPAGMVRALRAELTRACADALVAPYLRATREPIDAEVGDALLALALSARWARASSKPKPFTGDGTESEVARYHADVLLPWKERELEKLLELERASAIAQSSGYASALIALAAERAFRELLWSARSAPVPERVKKSYEARARYYGALDAAFADVRTRVEELEERASAALSAQGIHRAPDADARYHPHSAQAVYGHRDDGYWGLLLLEPPRPLIPATASERIALRVPSTYSEILFGDATLTSVRMLRALVETGLSPRQRYAVSKRNLGPAEVELLAYFRATLAQRTRDARQWDEAVALLEPLSRRSPEAELVLATARAARSGPRDHRSSRAEERTFDVAALERFAESAASPRLRAFALNNAARLLALSSRIPALEAARTLSSEARALAQDGATRACVRPLESSRFERESEVPCDLPTLP